jgi:hypothetical protein
MRKIITLAFFILASSATMAQGRKFNITCIDFTFQGRKSNEGANIRKNFESALPKFSYLFNVVERQEMTILFQKIQEEQNLYKDFNTISKKPELAGVDYLVIGDITAKSNLDGYRVNLYFAKLTGNEITTKLPMQVLATKEELLDEDQMKRKFEMALKEFTENYFVTSTSDWIKAPNFYKELEKRDSAISILQLNAANTSNAFNNLSFVINDLKKENTLKDEQISKLSKSVTEIREYSNTALLNMYGSNFNEGYGLKVTSTLIDLMHQVFTVNGSEMKVILNDSALEAANKAIQISPKFPFAYYAKAAILDARHDSKSLEAADTAYKILKITTTIEGHHPHHDLFLAAIKKYFVTSD